MDSHASSLVFSMPIWFDCSWFSALLCSDLSTIILLPHMTIPSVIATSSLNDQYDCSFFCTSAFVDGQLHMTYSDSTLGTQFLGCQYYAFSWHAV